MNKKALQKFIVQCTEYIDKHGDFNYRAIAPAARISSDPLSEAVEYIEEKRGLLFVQQLFLLIDKTGKKDSEIYKKAGIDRRLFSKIRSDKTYIPSKKTVISLCLALELEREEADSLLSVAGYSLSQSSVFDLVIAFCIERKIFDILAVDEILNHFEQEGFNSS